MNRIENLQPNFERRPKLKLSDVMIRWMERRDLSAVASIERDVFGVKAWRKEQVEYCVTTIGMSSRVLVHNGTVSGYVFWSLTENSMEIERIAIANRKQRWGLGTFLVNDTIAWMRPKKAVELWCDAPEMNLATQWFLSASGFRKEEQVEHDEGPHYRLVWSRPEQDSSALARIR